MIAANTVKLRKLAARFACNDVGATAIEYSLIAAMIAVVCIGAFNLLGSANGGGWGGMANKAIAAMQK
jgi:pilus assembly protein Flp/PilA